MSSPVEWKCPNDCELEYIRRNSRNIRTLRAMFCSSFVCFSYAESRTHTTWLTRYPPTNSCHLVPARCSKFHVWFKLAVKIILQCGTIPLHTILYNYTKQTVELQPLLRNSLTCMFMYWIGTKTLYRGILKLLIRIRHEIYRIQRSQDDTNNWVSSDGYKVNVINHNLLSKNRQFRSCCNDGSKADTSFYSFAKTKSYECPWLF